MKKLDLKNCIVTMPDKQAVYAAVVLYGGLWNMEGGWFLKQNRIPAELLESLHFIMPNHFTNKCKDCLDEFEKEVNTRNIGSYSLCGFSRGAQEVYRNRSLEQWEILGLIDPSAPTLDIFKDDVLDNFVDKIRCVYWVPNWGKSGYDGRVPRFAQHLRDLKVEMVEKAVPHPGHAGLFLQAIRQRVLSFDGCGPGKNWC